MVSAKRHKSSLLILIFLFLAGILANKASGYYALEYYLGAPLKGNYLFAGLEGIKGVVGDYFWVKADDYYHGGVSTVARRCRALHIHEDTGDEFIEETRQSEHVDFIQKINAAIVVNEHRHLEGEEAKEILPWFRLATLLNPHNVDCYIDGAFWLERKFREPQQAMNFLREGMENNPDDWRIYREFAFLYYYRGDFGRAIESLNKSESLWKDEDSPNQNERGVMYDFLGYLYEEAGDYTKAVHSYKRFLEIFPDNQLIKDKIKDIKQCQGE